ncbi:hypothetical protein [Bathymodiolus septemdierum thioautotrophic gill symbiont]|uniref:Uncharacterized protein n=1 Tax=endosymbiont of Bathymodiolus septemdierum str. Myojin knoll TaxID=1303921 RepID=A0A0P0UR30_9GAMM|nr:hypothetical protein [Bathymodiolus septemdierum thioautotrophic gill symbiont]BAS67251.1 conserved hypothetical protein [endosymbiont of Bathymodiolus septemdierum str. Myojin knoll]
MKKLLIIVSSLFSVSVLAHSGHTPFEFVGVTEVFKHYFASSYHIIAMLTIGVALMLSAVIVSKRKQILSAVLMVLGLVGLMLGMSLLLS